MSNATLINDVIAFAAAAVKALLDGKISKKEAKDLIEKGTVLIADLGAILLK